MRTGLNLLPPIIYKDKIILATWDRAFEIYDLHTGKVDWKLKYYKKNNSRISHTNYKIIDKNNNLLGINIAKDNLNYQELINSCDIGLSTVMIQKDVFKISMFKNIKTNPNGT